MFVIDDQIDVEYRLGTRQPVKTRWSLSPNNKQARIFGKNAIKFIQSLKDVDEMYIRIREKNGSVHDGKFDLRGKDRAIDAVAEACGWEASKLSATDIKAIQKLLSSAGYYAGPIDGIWGAGSREALILYQNDRGLEKSGVLNSETLRSLGQF